MIRTRSLPVLLLTFVGAGCSESAHQKRAKVNFKITQMALSVYDDVEKKLPESAIKDKKGEPLLSWRVAVLGYMEQENLRRLFKYDEPWDSLANRPLVEQMPIYYRDPEHEVGEKTRNQVFVGPGTPFEPGKAIRMSDIEKADGLANTIMVVEARDPVIWTEPEDVKYDPKAPLPELGRPKQRSAFAAMADGSVRFIRNDIAETTLRALITWKGKESVPGDWDK